MLESDKSDISRVYIGQACITGPGCKDAERYVLLYVRSLAASEWIYMYSQGILNGIRTGKKRLLCEENVCVSTLTFYLFLTIRFFFNALSYTR